MRRAVLLKLFRMALTTEWGRRLLELAATADDGAAMQLLEQLGARFGARIEIRDFGR
jgi:hypothetical protein